MSRCPCSALTRRFSSAVAVIIRRFASRRSTRTAVNLFGAIGLEQLQHKLEVLRAHCATEGRDYDAIEKTVQTQFNVADGEDTPEAIIERLHEFASLGFTRAIGSVKGVERLQPLEVIGREIIPQVESL